MIQRNMEDLEINTGSSTFEELARRFGADVKAQVAFGDPVEQDGTVVIPVARVAWGFGRGGSMDGKTPGPNGGGGASIRPAGYIEISGGKARYYAIRDWSTIIPVVMSLLLVFMIRPMLRRSASRS